ncbi:MAG: VRR-NUC domain-containing protein [Prevotellaceae bacterium]|nr:VRR-NUC domain-containing protein [Prevotellaceae bacterium]
MQIACVRYFDYKYSELSKLLHHSPNGGKRNAREAARFKAMGVRAGFPDLILLVENAQYNYLCIELKSAKGTQTDLQHEYQKIVEKSGGQYRICRSLDDFINIIDHYLGKRI